MALINITPIMTSNTTPSPYNVTASTELNATTPAWKAFDRLDATQWHSLAGVNQSIRLDFGAITRVDAISLKANSATSAPKNFIVYGSNDSATYEKILECNNEILWAGGEIRLFKFSQYVNFKFYKIITSADNGYGYITLMELQFWQDDGVTIPVTNIKASMSYCLPKNSTLAMNQRVNDAREGLLGFANDSINYGTLYMVDKTGKAIIPRAKLANHDVLFDGAITQATSIALTSSYNDYSYLYFYVALPSWSAQQDYKVVYKQAIFDKVGTYAWYLANSPTSLNDANTQKQLSIQLKTGNDSIFAGLIYLYFTGEKSIYIPIISLTSVTPVTLRIFGVK